MERGLLTRRPGRRGGRIPFEFSAMNPRPYALWIFLS